MISFDLDLSLPEIPNFKVTNDIFFKYGKTRWPNKFWEVQIAWWNPTGNFFTLRLDTRWTGRDHAGVSFDITILGLMFAAQIYDCRHWNDKANRFQTDEEAMAEGEEWQNTKTLRKEELREKVFGAIGTATLPGTSDRLTLQNGNIGYDGEFSLDGFVNEVFKDDTFRQRPRDTPGGLNGLYD